MRSSLGIDERTLGMNARMNARKLPTCNLSSFSLFPDFQLHLTLVPTSSYRFRNLATSEKADFLIPGLRVFTNGVAIGASLALRVCSDI